MQTRRTASLVGTLILLIYLTGSMGCSKSDDPSDEYAAVGLLALSQGGSNTIVGSSESLSATTGVSAAASATSTGIGSTSVSFIDLNKQVQTRLLADVLHKMDKNTGIPTSIPTVFTCQDGTCNNGASETLTGTASCMLGGTITADNVSSTIASDSGTISMTMIGPFIYSSCQTYAIDFNNFPNNALASLTGTINYNGTLSMNYSSSTVGSTTTLAGTGSSNTGLTSSSLTVNSITYSNIDITMSTTSNFNYSLVSGSSFSGTSSGTYVVTGTVNGSPININATFNLTF